MDNTQEADAILSVAVTLVSINMGSTNTEMIHCPDS